MKTETKKTDFEKIKKFEKWMKKMKNIYIGSNERMCSAYEIIIN